MGYRGGALCRGDTKTESKISVFYFGHRIGHTSSVSNNGLGDWLFDGFIFRLGIFGDVVIASYRLSAAVAATAEGFAKL